MGMMKHWKLKLYDKQNHSNHTCIEAKFKTEEDSSGKIWSIEGEFLMPYEWHVSGDSRESDHMFFFSTTWENEAVLNFKGEDFNEENEYEGYYQLYRHDTVYLSDALQFILWLQHEFIAKSGVYVYPEDIEYVENNPVYDKYKIALEEIVDEQKS